MIDGINLNGIAPQSNPPVNTPSGDSQSTSKSNGSTPPPPSPKKVDSVNLSAAYQGTSTQSEEATESAQKEASEYESPKGNNINLLA